MFNPSRPANSANEVPQVGKAKSVEIATEIKDVSIRIVTSNVNLAVFVTDL
jgi:hypothetical protein